MNYARNLNFDYIQRNPALGFHPLAKSKGLGNGWRMLTVREYLKEHNAQANLFDGLDAAILGVGNQYTKDPLVIYSARNQTILQGFRARVGRNLRESVLAHDL